MNPLHRADEKSVRVKGTEHSPVAHALPLPAASISQPINMKIVQTPYFAAALIISATANLCAEDSKISSTNAVPATASAGAEPEEPWWKNAMPKAISQGKLLLNARLRYEHADQSNLDASDAFTIRTRLGYETAPIKGFRGLLEFEDVSIIGNENNYNQAGLNPGGAGKTVIADPETTEVNRAWIGYENFDTFAKYGRQRITLDDHRFVGNVGWRQNEQTYDGLTLANDSIQDTTLFYSYIYEVNRVLGDDHPGGNFDSRSHLFNASNSTLPFATVSLYSYLLDFDNAPTSSSASYGASVVGDITVSEEHRAKIDYRLQYAFQSDYGDQPVDYGASYYKIEVGGQCSIYSAGVGYEVLGSDNDKGFATPLATLHAFNGWADVFLNTPNEGLEDLYFSAGVTLPWGMPLKLVYHQFYSQQGSDNYGHELDAVISKKFGKHWTVLAKYAYYDGKDDPFGSGSAIDTQKGWLQLEFAY